MAKAVFRKTTSYNQEGVITTLLVATAAKVTQYRYEIIDGVIEVMDIQVFPPQFAPHEWYPSRWAQAYELEIRKVQKAAIRMITREAQLLDSEGIMMHRDKKQLLKAG